MLLRVSPRARLHPREPSTSPCSAPRSYGIGESPSCSTWDRFRCFQAAAAVRLVRNRDAALRTASHSIIPKQFFSSTLILASGPLSELVIHSFIVEELMENGQDLSATWCANSDCRIEVVWAAMSPSLSAKCRRETYFRKNFQPHTAKWSRISCLSDVLLESR